MITPKEKAEDLVIRFMQYTPAEEHIEYEYAIQCAFIAVEELIKESCKYSLFKNADYQESRIAFFTEVKREIEKL